MPARRNDNQSILQRLEKVTTPACARFLCYYYTPENERRPWDEFKKCHDQLNKKETFEDCLPWLEREDVQKAMLAYRKATKLRDLSNLYDRMMQKAMEGDTKAADWIVKFTESQYFDESTDEIDDFLSGVNIPGLKGE